MKVNLLREFVCFAKHLSITLAAEELYLSQPALSKHMAELEKMLGVTLIEHGKNPRLTSIGNLVLSDASYIVQTYDMMLEKCQKHRESALQKEIRVIDPPVPSLGAQFLYTMIADYSSANPNSRIHFRSTDKISPFKLMDNNMIDVFLKYDYEDERGDISKKRDLDAIPITEEPLLLWCHKDSWLAKKNELFFSDLKNVPIMGTTSTPNPLKATIVKLGKKRGFVPLFATYSSLTQSEFFLKSSPENNAYIITPLFAEDMRIKARKDMTVRGFSDSDIKTTCYIIIRRDSDNQSLKDFDFYINSVISKEQQTEP